MIDPARFPWPPILFLAVAVVLAATGQPVLAGVVVGYILGRVSR